jgi:hypothetical protein
MVLGALIWISLRSTISSAGPRKYSGGFTTLGGYNALPGAVNSTAYVNQKILRAGMAGREIRNLANLYIAAGAYHYFQNDYNTQPCTNGGLPASGCAGTLDALSAMVDYRPLAGSMFMRASCGRRAI